MRELKNLQFKNSVIFVQDVHRSKQFYTKVLGQKIVQDYGKYVGFEGGFGIWEKAYAFSIIFREQGPKSSYDDHRIELYFESEALDDIIRHLKTESVSFIHGCQTYEWGQRGIRIQDPDGIIIEISEPMRSVVLRYCQQGLSVSEISEKTGMAQSEIESML